MIVIKFENPVSEEKILHYLRHTKKSYPHFSRCVSEIKKLEGILEYILKGTDGKEVAGCSFAVNENEILFTDFKGDGDLKKMLQIHLVDEIGEWAVVSKDESLMFYDGSNFFLEDKGKCYKLGEDREILIEVEKCHVPNQLKNEIVGNSI